MIKTFKVGGIVYSVNEKEAVEIDGDFNYRGSCDKNMAIIEIKRDMNEQKKQQTLLHELLHAMFEESGLDIDNEEDIVCQIAPVLHQVLKDNDFSFLQDKETVTVYTTDGKVEHFEK